MSNKKINTVSSEMGSGYYYCPYTPVNLDEKDYVTVRKTVLEHLKGIIDVMKMLPRKNVEDICTKLSDAYDIDINLRESVILSELNILDFRTDTPRKIFIGHYRLVAE